MSRRLQSLDFTPSPSFWWNPLCKKALPISLLLSSSSSFSAAAEGRRRESFAWWRHQGKLGGFIKLGRNQGKLATTRTFERHFVSTCGRIFFQGDRTLFNISLLHETQLKLGVFCGYERETLSSPSSPLFSLRERTVILPSKHFISQEMTSYFIFAL